MNRNSTWNSVLSLIVSLFFFWIGIQLLLDGQFLFAVVWLLINGTILVGSIQTCRSLFKRRKKDGFEFTNQTSFDEDVYGHRTQASYEKERLKKVEDLYQSGLISKTEYEEKRKEIIDHI